MVMVLQPLLPLRVAGLLLYSHHLQACCPSCCSTRPQARPHGCPAARWRQLRLFPGLGRAGAQQGLEPGQVVRSGAWGGAAPRLRWAWRVAAVERGRT